MTIIPDSLTEKDLNHMRKLMAKGRLAKAYDALTGHGYRYAELANGVVKGNSFSGTIALEYLAKSAEEQGIPLSEMLLDSIRNDMAIAYLDALSVQLNSKEKKVNRDILAEEAWHFHSAVFKSKGLNPDAWTLNLPFTCMDAEARDLYWKSTLNSVGNFAKELLLGFATDLIMKHAAINIFEPAKAGEAWAWLHRLHNLDTYLVAVDAVRAQFDSLAANLPEKLFSNFENGLQMSAIQSIVDYINNVSINEHFQLQLKDLGKRFAV